MSLSNRQRVWQSIIFAVSTFIVLTAPVAQEQGYLEEIIVTAQKRAQNIQDIPAAVTALSGEHLIEHGITDMFDMIRRCPWTRPMKQRLKIASR